MLTIETLNEKDHSVIVVEVQAFLGPDVCVLAQRAVPGAGHVAEDPVELERRELARIGPGRGVRHQQVRHDRGVVVGHHDARRLQPLDLVSTR